MRIVRQPPKSLLCGQACLAMVLDLSLDEVISLAGAEPLGNRSIQVHPRIGEPGISRPAHVSLCLTVRKAAPNERGHWLVWDGVQFLDPSDGQAHLALDEDWEFSWVLPVYPEPTATVRRRDPSDLDLVAA